MMLEMMMGRTRGTGHHRVGMPNALPHPPSRGGSSVPQQAVLANIIELVLTASLMLSREGGLCFSESAFRPSRF
jgi:hypothetical protein